MLNILKELDKSGGFTHCFLATYGFMPGFFEDRVLSSPALSGCPNIVVFVDESAYRKVCSEPLGGRLMNRRYLLIPISLPRQGYGVFHPKVWLFGGPKNAKLFVGSANLTRPGITSNLEMLSVFDHETAKPKGLSQVISSAYKFFKSLVDAVHDAATPQV